VRIDLPTGAFVDFLDDDAPLPDGEYCVVCTIWIVPGFGHDTPRGLAHRLCTTLAEELPMCRCDRSDCPYLQPLPPTFVAWPGEQVA
jgi:hypothetical protein